MIAKLEERIRQRVGGIPANNPGYISVASNTLARILAAPLLDRIAKEASLECADALAAKDAEIAKLKAEVAEVKSVLSARSGISSVAGPSGYRVILYFHTLTEMQDAREAIVAQSNWLKADNGETIRERRPDDEIPFHPDERET